MLSLGRRRLRLKKYFHTDEILLEAMGHVFKHANSGPHSVNYVKLHKHLLNAYYVPGIILSVYIN